MNIFKIAIIFIISTTIPCYAQFLGLRLGIPHGTPVPTVLLNSGGVVNNAMTFNGQTMLFNGSTMTFTHS